MGKEYSILLSTKNKASAEFKKVDAEAKAMSKAIRTYGVQGGEGLKTMQREFKKLEAEAKSLGVKGTAGLSKLDNQLKRLEGTSKKTSRTMGSMSLPAWMAPAALVSIGVSMIKTAGDFETAFLRISTLIDGDVDPKIDKLKRGVIEMSKEFPKTPQELGAPVYDILSAGFTDTDKALEVLRGSTKLSIAGLGEQADAVDLTTTMLNAFKRENLEADQAVGMLFTTIKQGKTTVDEMNVNFGKGAASAAAANVKARDYLSTISALTAQGIKSREAETYSAALYDELSKGSDKFNKALKKAHISAAQFRDMMGEQGVGKALEFLQTKLKMTDEDMKKMFSSAEAGKTAYILLGDGAQNYSDTMEMMIDTQGRLNAAVEKNSKGINNSSNSLSAAWQRLAITVGDSGLNEKVAWALDEITSTIDYWIDNGLAGLTAWPEAWWEFLSTLPKKYWDFIKSFWGGVADYMKSTSSSMWESIKSGWSRDIDDIVGKLRRAKQEVVDLWNSMKDIVVGHSIVPDMMDAIGVEFNRLDTIMVAKTENAIGKTNQAFTKLESPEAMARPERVSKRKKSKEDIKFEQAQAAYDANQREIKATEDLNKMMDDLYKEGLDDHARAVYEEDQLYQEQITNYQTYLSNLSEEQKAKAEALNWEAQITEAHNRRMAKLEKDNAKKIADIERKSAHDAWAAKDKKLKAYSDIASSTAEILGAGVKEQAAVMIPLELAQGASDLAEGGWPPNPEAIAAGLAHFAAAASWGRAASAGSGGGGGGGKRGGGGGGRNRNDVPGRGQEAPPPTGEFNAVLDTGRLRGKMVMGEVQDITNWIADQLRSKSQQNGRISVI